MQIKLLFRLVLSLIPLTAIAQSTYIRTGSDEYQLLDRLEIKLRPDGLTQSFLKPYSKKWMFSSIIDVLKDSTQTIKLSTVDRYNLDKFINDPEFDTTRNTFSKRKGGFLMIDPVSSVQYSKESNSENDPFIASVGADIRGVVFKKIGINLYTTANAERLPGYLSSWTSRYNAVV